MSEKPTSFHTRNARHEKRRRSVSRQRKDEQRRHTLESGVGGAPKLIEGRELTWPRDRDLLGELLDMVSLGATLKRACEELGASERSVRACISKDLGADATASPPTEGLYARFERASELQADAWADEIVSIADVASSDTAAQARLRIETRKWLMSKRKPAAYGDKTTVAHEGGDPSRPIRSVTGEMSPEEAARVYAETIKRS